MTLVKDEMAVAVGASWVPRAPVQGTQSFVHVMGAVWQRPGVTGLEVLWRWAIGIPLLLGLARHIERLWPSLAIDTTALSDMTVFRPLEAFGTIQATGATLAPVFMPFARWFVPLALVAWSLAWVLGRSVVLRQLDATLRFRFATLFLLRLVRSALLLTLLCVWAEGVRWAATVALSGPAAHAHEPNLVSFCALVICGSLGMFVGWAAVNWILDAAPLLAMRHGFGPAQALKAALSAGAARGRLVETNLVLSIVKIALLVLALVFSACPLPFQDVATAEFLRNWSIGVAILYFLASDYFHVVRSVAYLTHLHETGTAIHIRELVPKIHS